MCPAQNRWPGIAGRPQTLSPNTGKAQKLGRAGGAKRLEAGDRAVNVAGIEATGATGAPAAIRSTKGRNMAFRASMIDGSLRSCSTGSGGLCRAQVRPVGAQPT